MQAAQHIRNTLICIILFSLCLSGCDQPGKAYAATTDTSVLAPEKDQVKASLAILRQLESHYAEKELNDDLSDAMLESYLDFLDPQHIYFIQSDIQTFEKYRFTLDDALKKGNLNPGFEIYNRYQQRVIESLHHRLGLLSEGIEEIDLEKDEYITIDRSELPWPKDHQEYELLWNRQLKNSILNLKLTDKTNEEVQTTLKKRFDNQLKRTQQSRNEDAFQSYINSLAQLYDPHTSYLSPRRSENFNINMSLSLEGIGAVLQTEDEYTKVVRLVPAGPADKAGQLQPSDKIIGVAQGDDEMVDVVFWRLDEVVNLIRGRKGSTVRLKIIPANAKDASASRVIKIVRDEVKLEEQAAQSQVIEIPGDNGEIRKIGVIELQTFYIDFRAQREGDPNYRSTTRDVRRLIKELKSQDVDGIVMDLRDNGGGSLEEANSLVGLFIPYGPVVQIKDANGNISKYGDQDANTFYQGPLAVLVNRFSASASEIFAGAIQDYGRGLIIGEQTFGKGTVQTLRPLQNEGQLKITQAKFYRISGGSNQHKGIIPDIVYPSLVDKDEIGESALPNALPWDTIRAAKYRKIFNLSPYLNDIREQHISRSENNPDFIFLQDQLQVLNENRQQTQLSLKESTRRQEREEDRQRSFDIENKRRKAKGEELLKSIEELEELAENQNTDEEDKEPDAFLVESANILNDLIYLQVNAITQSTLSHINK